MIHGYLRHFARDDQGIGTDHDSDAFTDAKSDRFDEEIVVNPRRGVAFSAAVPSESQAVETALGRLLLRRIERRSEAGSAKTGGQFTREVCGPGNLGSESVEGSGVIGSFEEWGVPHSVQATKGPHQDGTR